MGEVSEMFDVNPSLIRFWEQKFDILKPHKNKKGNRMFTPEDVENLKIIYHLVKEKGMTLAGAEKRLKENREGVVKNLEIIDKLQGIKSLLLEIKQELKDDGSGYEEIFIENHEEHISIVSQGHNKEHVKTAELYEGRYCEPTPAASPDWELAPITPQDQQELDDDIKTAQEIAGELMQSEDVRIEIPDAEPEQEPEPPKPRVIEQTLF